MRDQRGRDAVVGLSRTRRVCRQHLGMTACSFRMLFLLLVDSVISELKVTIKVLLELGAPTIRLGDDWIWALNWVQLIRLDAICFGAQSRFGDSRSSCVDVISAILHLARAICTR